MLLVTNLSLLAWSTKLIPEQAFIFTDRASKLLGDNLQSVVLVGSFARDDERAASDIDLVVILRNADIPTIRSIGTLVRELNSPNEINPAVISEDEIRSNPDWNELLKIRHDGICLFGELPPGLVANESELVAAKRIANEVLMSCRHYLAVDEPVESFQSGKLWVYVQKPLSFSARYYHYAQKGQYIRRLDDLKGAYPILAVDSTLNPETVIEHCIEFALEILNT